MKYLAFLLLCISTESKADDLPHYFKNKSDEIVKLYRGVDYDQIDPDFEGESSLIFTSEDIEAAIFYAVNNADGLWRRLDRVLVLRIEVPRSMVFMKHSWPVLKQVDYPNIKEIVTGIGEIKLTEELANVAEKYPGNSSKMMKFLKNNLPGLLNEEGVFWFTGSKMKKFYNN